MNRPADPPIPEPRRRDARWLTRLTVCLLALAVLAGITLPYLSQRAIVSDKNKQVAVLRSQRAKSDARATAANERADKAETRLVAVVCDDIEPLKSVAALFAALIVNSPNASAQQKRDATPYATPAPRPKDCPPPA